MFLFLTFFLSIIAALYFMEVNMIGIILASRKVQSEGGKEESIITKEENKLELTN